MSQSDIHCQVLETGWAKLARDAAAMTADDADRLLSTLDQLVQPTVGTDPLIASRWTAPFCLAVRGNRPLHERLKDSLDWRRAEAVADEKWREWFAARWLAKTAPAANRLRERQVAAWGVDLAVREGVPGFEV